MLHLQKMQIIVQIPFLLTQVPDQTADDPVCLCFHPRTSPAFFRLWIPQNNAKGASASASEQAL